MIGRSREIVACLAKRKVDICCVQESRWKGASCKFIGDGNEKYKFFWSGDPTGEAGVGILVKEENADDVVEVKRINSRIMWLKIKLGDELLAILSAYAPQQGRSNEDKDIFWNLLTDEVEGLVRTDNVLICGDLNGHVGEHAEGYTSAHGGFGYGNRNIDGERILEFAESLQLQILNTFYKKPKSHLITYQSGLHESQIDFMLTVTNLRMKCHNIKTIPGEECIPQHRLLVADFLTANSTKKRVKEQLEPKIKVWKLRDKEVQEEFKRIAAEELAPSMDWTHLKNTLLNTAKEVCGVTKGTKRRRHRETWWFNEEVRQAITAKRTAYKKWKKSLNKTDEEAYKTSKRKAKQVIAIAMTNALEEVWSSGNEQERLQKLYKIAKNRKKEKQDVTGTTCIRDRNGHILINTEQICARWREYYHELLNETNGPVKSEDCMKVKGPIEQITETEVMEAIKSMKPRKSPGPSGLSADLIKAAGLPAIHTLTHIFRAICSTETIPLDFAKSTTIPIYKGKGDPLNCASYRGIRLLEHGMKIFEKVLESRLRKLIQIDGMQYGFTPQKSTIDPIFILRQLQEKFIAKKKQLHHLFVDLEKAFDRVPREIVKWALRRQHIPEKLVRLAMATYESAKTVVKSRVGVSDELDITVGVHQGSVLSPLLFITVMEEATKLARKGAPMDLLYADDLVLTARDQNALSEKFIRWNDHMAKRGLRVNPSKTKYMVSGEDAPAIKTGKYPCAVCSSGVGSNSILCSSCNMWCHKKCSGVRQKLTQIENRFLCPTCVSKQTAPDIPKPKFKANGVELERVHTFTYLGDTMQCNGGAEASVRARIQAVWLKWKTVGGLLVQKNIPLKARAKVYQSCIRPVLLYGSETWPMNKTMESTLHRTEMKLLRWMLHVQLSNKIRSEDILKRFNMKTIAETMRKRRLQWFGHTERSSDENILFIRQMEVQGQMPRGRPKKTWAKTIKEDLEAQNLCAADAQNRVIWQHGINRPTPNREK